MTLAIAPIAIPIIVVQSRLGITCGTAALLSNDEVLAYGNKFLLRAEFHTPSTNAWARTSGQCGNDISYDPLLLLGTDKALLARDGITYSGHKLSNHSIRALRSVNQ